MNKKIKLLIVISLLLNILLSGLVLGHLYRHFTKGGVPPHMESALDTLPSTKQQAFRDAMGAMREENKAEQHAMREAREAIAESLRAELFDPVLYQARVNVLHLLQAQQRQRMADVIKDLAQQWNAEERQVLSGMVMRHPHEKRHDKPCAEVKGE